MKNGLDYFRRLHLAIQMVLTIGAIILAICTIVLLIIIAISHSAEENLISFLLVAVALYSKTHNKDKPK